jgi:hypothetical protein
MTQPQQAVALLPFKPAPQPRLCLQDPAGNGGKAQRKTGGNNQWDRSSQLWVLGFNLLHRPGREFRILSIRLLYGS